MKEDGRKERRTDGMKYENKRERMEVRMKVYLCSTASLFIMIIPFHGWGGVVVKYQNTKHVDKNFYAMQILQFLKKTELPSI